MYTHEDLTAYFDAKRLLNSVTNDMRHRVHQIAKLICSAFGRKLDWWDWDYSEDSYGKCEPQIAEDDELKDEFSWVINCKGSNNLATDYWDYSDGFPIEFLFMDDEEITKVVKTEIAKDKASKAEEKAKQKEKQSKQAEFKKKLAIEEKRLKKELGIK